MTAEVSKSNKIRFALFNTMFGETVCLIEMDESLLAPEAGIMDVESMTMRPIKNGGTYTLLPTEDHTLSILKRVEQAYLNLTTKPIQNIGHAFQRQDTLTETVRLLFSEVEYNLVESKEDMDKLINPPKDGSYEPKKVKYHALGDLMAKQLAETAVPDGTTDGEAQK